MAPGQASDSILDGFYGSAGLGAFLAFGYLG